MSRGFFAGVGWGCLVAGIGVGALSLFSDIPLQVAVNGPPALELAKPATVTPPEAVSDPTQTEIAEKAPEPEAETVAEPIAMAEPVEMAEPQTPPVAEATPDKPVAEMEPEKPITEGTLDKPLAEIAEPETQPVAEVTPETPVDAPAVAETEAMAERKPVETPTTGPEAQTAGPEPMVTARNDSAAIRLPDPAPVKDIPEIAAIAAGPPPSPVPDQTALEPPVVQPVAEQPAAPAATGSLPDLGVGPDAQTAVIGSAPSVVLPEAADELIIASDPRPEPPAADAPVARPPVPAPAMPAAVKPPVVPGVQARPEPAAPPAPSTTAMEAPAKLPPVLELTPGNTAENAVPRTPALPDSGSGVKVNRLPRIGAESPVAPAPEADTETAVEDTRPAVDRFARPFENTDGKPLFSILLQDTGAANLDRQSIAAIDFPISFIIDPAVKNAQGLAQIYRDAGQEVVMLASALPEGGNASDLAVTFEVYAQVLPEAVAVLDSPTGGYQGNRSIAAQVVPIIGDQGRGVLSWDKGLNAVSQIARRDGLKSAVIFRQLDAEGEAQDLIRRYLDRAAFKAAQDGRVAVVGTTRPETIAAILEWAIEGRAATVALAPISAVMVAQ